MKKINYKVLLYCFLISLIILFFTSKSSPFYPFNDWVDANAFMTVGKSMMKGIVPYKSLFEQKGPILYLIYGIASLINNTSFIGVFILEIIFMSCTLYFCYLIIKMFLNDKYSLLLLPIFLLLMTTSSSFTHGSSCEEFMFLFESLALYYFIRHFKEQKMNYKEFVIVGFVSGIVLLMKYTSLGLFFAFMLIIFLSFIKKREYKKGLLTCLYFLIGFSIPIIITLIYFGINGGIKDFINVYFIINMTSYSKKVSIFVRIISVFLAFLDSLKHNNIIVISLVLLYPLLIWKLSIKKNIKISLIVIYLFTIFSVFFGLKSFVYYVLPVNFFILLSLISLFSLIKNSWIEKNYKIILSIVLIICFSLSYLISNNKDFHNIKKEDLFQYKFSKEINKTSNPTVVNMGFLDCGIYTMGNIYPTTYYFELQNFDYQNYPNNIDSFNEYIRNKETTYIVYVKKNNIDKNDIYMDKQKLIENYDIILEEAFTFENTVFVASLWKVK